MSLPAKIKIQGTEYAIALKDRIDGDGDNVAYIDHERQEISIKAGMGKEYTERCLWHEIIHAITEMGQVDWGEKDEQYTEIMANGVHQVLKDNSEMREKISQ